MPIPMVVSDSDVRSHARKVLSFAICMLVSVFMNLEDEGWCG